MRLTQLTKAVAIASVIAAPLAVAAPAASAGTEASSAFGISATGAVPIPPVPAVSSSASQPTRKSLLEVPANPLLQASVLATAASAGHARASVTDLKVAKIGLAAHLITSKCENGSGSSTLIKVVLNGRVLKAGAQPNTTATVGLGTLGSASVVINKQVRDADGRLTVTALELSVPLGPGKFETISISSATCGRSAEAPTQPGLPSQTPAPSPSTPPGAAPVPTPVTGDLPVTG
jgi:hypothetical protein